MSCGSGSDRVWPGRLNVELLQHLYRPRVVARIDECDGPIVLCGLGRIAADGVEQDIGVEKRALGTRAPMLVRQLTRPASTVASHDTTNGTEATSSSGCARRRHSQKPYCRGSTKIYGWKSLGSNVNGVSAIIVIRLLPA